MFTAGHVRMAWKCISWECSFDHWCVIIVEYTWKKIVVRFVHIDCVWKRTRRVTYVLTGLVVGKSTFHLCTLCLPCLAENSRTTEEIKDSMNIKLAKTSTNIIYTCHVLRFTPGICIKDLHKQTWIAKMFETLMMTKMQRALEYIHAVCYRLSSLTIRCKNIHPLNV